MSSGGATDVKTDETVTAAELTAWVRADGTIWSWSEWDSPTVLPPAPLRIVPGP